MADDRKKLNEPGPYESDPGAGAGMSRRDFVKGPTMLGMSLLMAQAAGAIGFGGDLTSDVGSARVSPSSPDPAVRLGLGVVIVGASSGLGAEIARQHADARASVVLAARRRDRLGQVARQVSDRGGLPLVVPTDVRQESDCIALIRRAVDWLRSQGRGIDVLVLGALRPIAAVIGPELSTRVWENSMQTSFFGPMHCLRYALPHLKERRSTVFYLNSMASNVSVPAAFGYAATKAAWRAMLQVLKFENPELGVVSSHFSAIETEAFDKELTMFNDDHRYCPSFSRTYGGLAREKLCPVSIAANKAIAAIESGSERVFLSYLNQGSWLAAEVRQDLGWFLAMLEVALGFPEIQRLETLIGARLFGPGGKGYAARLLSRLKQEDPGSEMTQAARVIFSLDSAVSVFLLALEELIGPATLAAVRAGVAEHRQGLADGLTQRLLLALSSGALSPTGIAPDLDGFAPVTNCPPAGI